MDVSSHIDLLSILAYGLIAVSSLLLGVLAWIANKTYDKLQAIEKLFTEHLLTVASIDSRVIRLEAQVDSILNRRRERDDN